MTNLLQNLFGNTNPIYKTTAYKAGITNYDELKYFCSHFPEGEKALASAVCEVSKELKEMAFLPEDSDLLWSSARVIVWTQTLMVLDLIAAENKDDNPLSGVGNVLQWIISNAEQAITFDMDNCEAFAS